MPEDRKDNPSGAELAANPNLKYARDLYVQLFEKTSPLTSLGYGPAQRELLAIALKQLENEVGHVYSPTHVAFSDNDGHYRASIGGLRRNNGWQMIATREIEAQIKSASDEDMSAEDLFLATLVHKPRVQFFEFPSYESSNCMAIINMLPSDINYEDITILVPNLYVTETLYSGQLEMREDNLLNRLRSKVKPDYMTPTYRAAWIDDETKLDLVVQYRTKLIDAVSKNDEKMPKEGAIDIWRRLPVQSLDGREWIPFGKKPSVSSEQAMKAFEKPESVVVGQFAPAFQRG